MDRSMQRLRAALMKTSRDQYWSKRDIARCRHLTPGNEAQRQAVMWSLRNHNGALLQRMQGCGEVDEHDNMQRCQVPLCPRCYMIRRGSETAKAINEVFPGVPNERLAHLTVLMPVDPDLASMALIMKRSELRLRNFLVRKRKTDPRWDEVHLLGYWELDRFRAGDIEGMGRNTRLFLQQSGAPVMADPDATLWLPHFHAAVALGDVSRKEFATALRGYGHHAAYQVDLRMFDVNRPVEHNIRDVVRYGNKFRVEEDYKGKPVFVGDEAEELGVWERHWWSQNEIRAYAEWLCGEQKGFQSLRLRIGKKTSVEAASAGARNVGEVGLARADARGSDLGKTGREGVRYNNTVQDTNWLPPYLRNKAPQGSDHYFPQHELFDFGCQAKVTPDTWSYLVTPSMPSTPSSRRSEWLDAFLREQLQRHA